MSSPRSPLRPVEPRSPSPIDEPSRRYGADATVLLVGFAGAGKKTLGIIASVALRRRFIDFEAAFRQEMQCSPQDYLARHGPAQYREMELELTRSLLEKRSTGCVIVGLGWSTNCQLLLLFREFARDHPVIYIHSDRTDPQPKCSCTVEARNRFFQSCSTFDFFNQTQELPDSVGRPLPAYMKLKETERVFLRFLYRIFGRARRVLYSSEPLSPAHTYALQVPLTWLERREPELEMLECGADAINLVVHIQHGQEHTLAGRVIKQMMTIRGNTRVPVLIELVPPAQPDRGGYGELLETLLRVAPDALVCPLDCAPESIRRLDKAKGYTKIIATYHQSTSWAGTNVAKMEALLQRTRNLGVDALRVTRVSSSPEDKLTCVTSQEINGKASRIPVIVNHRGSLGRASAPVNSILSPVVLPEMQDTGVTLASAQQALASCDLLPRTVFTLFGQHVAQSPVPAMHNAAYAACGLPHLYHVSADQLTGIPRLFVRANHGGVAITGPYKADILPFLQHISPDARDINTVDTVVIERRQQADGKQWISTSGFNTDHIGLGSCIRNHLSPLNANGPGRTALVVGASTMARAAIYACYQLGIRHICLYNRTAAKAQGLVDYYSRWAESKPGPRLHMEVLHSSDPWPAHLRQPTVILACLPAFHMGSQSPVTLQLPETWLESTTGGVFIDVTYGLPETPLRQAMRKRQTQGWVVVDGLSVLLEQNIVQYELLTKRPAPVHVMRRVLQQTVNAHCPGIIGMD
ncbi:hypothetical protein BO78DRAFT_437176 [Aspergillus sclerotiicarbonarius CBS 121057]|uniref:Shikimate dehydrogenase substrate binding N-terminal domain-containing protein n=1 Tax=Aspergillus sclerotiicarbonarius (strain CBS 121057 / IBT 28362) TaxID=1448318 RepID=A0A319EAZ1_ASPSB|nr:hypothetical protein BO78DRAFT_437176 [Aspergillus sclerotiicarbonarius CBS 121057]